MQAQRRAQTPARLTRLDDRKLPAHREVNVSNKPSQCTNVDCQSFSIIEEHGQQVCQECGAVCQELEIVNDNAFGEGRDGQLTMIGSQVGNDKTRGRPFGSGLIKGIGAFESQEIAERKGNAHDRELKSLADLKGQLALNRIASALNMSQSLRAPAMRLYRIAMGHNFIQGRSVDRVAAVCLYVASRVQTGDGQKYMLIDFADNLKINVFDLGHVYKDLVDQLCLNELGWRILPINPENLIQRFAQMLEFESSTQRVANDAVRIVARMDRDWMTIGRRPAGVCGAALILAARMNNFRRTVREVVFVVRVAEVTVNKRLDEFKVTESSKLTVEEFRKTDLEFALDPPSFYQKKGSKKKRGRPRKASQVQQNAEDHHRSERGTAATSANAIRQLQTPVNTQQNALADSQSMPPPSRPIAIDPALLQASAQGLAELISASDHDSPSRPARKLRRVTADQRKLAKQTEFEMEQREQITKEINSALPDVTKVANELTSQRSSPPQPPTPEPTQTSPNNPPSPEGSGTGALQRAQDEDTVSDQGDSEQETLPVDPKHTPRELPPPRSDQLITPDSTSQSLLDRISSSLTIEDSEFASDLELADCLLTDAEHEVKKRIWTQENKDWLRAQQAKELKRQFAEANGTEREVKRRKRRRTRMGDMSAYEGAEEGAEDGAEDGPFKDPADAVQKMMERRGYSRKINYSLLDWTYGQSSAASGAATPSESGMSVDTSREGSVVEGDEKAEGDEKGESEVKAVEPKREGAGTKRKREEEAVMVEDEGAAAGAGANAGDPIELSDAEEESDGEDYFPKGGSWRWGLYDSVVGDLGDGDYDEDD